MNEAEETIESLNQKVASTEKTKHRLETELEDLQLEYERVHAAAIITEKRGKNFDKVNLLSLIQSHTDVNSQARLKNYLSMFITFSNRNVSLSILALFYWELYNPF